MDSLEMYTESRHLSISGSVPHVLLKQIHLSECLQSALPVLRLAWLPPLTRPPQSSCRKKEQSEIWCCMTMAQTCTYHSAAAALPHWNVIDPATIHACCQLWKKNTHKKSRALFVNARWLQSTGSGVVRGWRNSIYQGPVRLCLCHSDRL